MVALEPVEHAQPRRNGERPAQGAEIAAEEPLDEKPRDEKRRRIGHERPGTHEFQDDGGLEGLDLGQMLRGLHARQRDAEKAEEDHVFERPEPFVQAPGQGPLRDVQRLGDAVQKFL